MWLRPDPGSPLDVLLRYAASADDALAKAFALATSADVAQVCVAGEVVRPTSGGRPPPDTPEGGRPIDFVDEWQ